MKLLLEYIAESSKNFINFYVLMDNTKNKYPELYKSFIGNKWKSFCEKYICFDYLLHKFCYTDNDMDDDIFITFVKFKKFYKIPLLKLDINVIINCMYLYKEEFTINDFMNHGYMEIINKYNIQNYPNIDNIKMGDFIRIIKKHFYVDRYDNDDPKTTYVNIKNKIELSNT